MSKLYLECYSGISGDMTVGALLDLGADREKLDAVLKSLPVDGFETKITSVIKSGITACDFDVILAEDNHDHDMAYLFGSDAPEAEHHHHHHDHDGHHHHGHSHSHVHRGLRDIEAIIGAADMTDGARKIALDIFNVIAHAEGRVHGKSIEEVHFHEVGAIDSIVDVISIAVCFDDLRTREQITEVIVPELYEGKGTIRCQHGVLPVPVPAVAAIAEKAGLRMHIMNENGEFVTPTGAAAVAALATTQTLPESFVVKRIGLGAGKREYKKAGILRALLIEQ